MIVVSEIRLSSEPDSTILKPLQEIAIDLIEHFKFTSGLPLITICLLWALIKWGKSDFLNGYMLNCVKNAESCKGSVKRKKILVKSEMDSIYTFLVNEAIKRIESEELPDTRDLKCFTGTLLELINSGLTDGELYIMEDFISPLMWMTTRVDDKKVTKNVKSFIDFLH